MQPSFPVDTQKALQDLMDAQRQLMALLAPGNASIQQSSRGAFEPFSTHRLDMLSNNNVYTPKRIGPHKSILYRGIVAISGGADTPQAFTQNDFAYYLAGRKDSDQARWMVLQVGKSMEFDFPVDEGWLFIPNPDRNPTFAIFETSVIGYVRSYQMAGVGSANQISDGSVINPVAAVTVDQSGGVVSKEIVGSGGSARTVTLYNQGPNTVWLGGQWVDGMGGGPYEAQPDVGVPLAMGEKVTIRNTAGISGATATGETAEVSYIIES
ncbi:MAG: hypothetical protein AB7T49_21585 [Oligoflexales bacterium]